MADDAQLAQATLPLSFAEFLERMKDPAAADLVRSIKNFIGSFEDQKIDPTRDEEIVQQFFAKSTGAFRQHPVWATGPQEHQAQAIEGLEKYLMTKIYAKTFAVSELDRERDQALYLRMKALKFVKPEHLDLPPSYKGMEAITRAQEQLAKINNYKAPRDKLVCILNCSRIINGILSVYALNKKGQVGGADDFLPVMIYVTIHANPQQLASNLEYIQRFRMRSKMVSESSYFYTQLYSAASFIETINVNSLTMDPDEFRARMIDANIPDMALFSDTPAEPSKQVEQEQKQKDQAQKQEEEDDESPFRASSLIPEPSAPDPTPTETDKQDAGTSKQDAAPKVSRMLSTDTIGKASEGRTSGKNSADSMRSLAEMEEAGYAHLLKDEASGALQKRHPFIYASAPELRISDVSHLLAAYKRIVLRYESLSLLLTHKQAALADGMADPNDSWNKIFDANAPGTLSSGPPAVEGPNPFAGGFLRGADRGDGTSEDSLDAARFKSPDGMSAHRNEEASGQLLHPGTSSILAGKQGSGVPSLESKIHGTGHKRQLASSLRMVGLPFRTSRSQPQGVPLPQLTEKSISGVLQDLEVPENSKTQGDNDLPGSLSHGKNDGTSKEKQAEISFKKCPVPSIFDDNNLEPSKDKRETKSAPQPVTPFMSLESVGQDLKTKQEEAKEDEKPESSPTPDGVEFRRPSTPSPFDTGDPPSGHGSDTDSTEGFAFSPFTADSKSESFAHKETETDLESDSQHKAKLSAEATQSSGPKPSKSTVNEQDSLI